MAIEKPSEEECKRIGMMLLDYIHNATNEKTARHIDCSSFQENWEQAECDTGYHAPSRSFKFSYATTDIQSMTQALLTLEIKFERIIYRQDNGCRRGNHGS